MSTDFVWNIFCALESTNMVMVQTFYIAFEYLQVLKISDSKKCSTEMDM
jgi:hypothetical protein